MRKSAWYRVLLVGDDGPVLDKIKDIAAGIVDGNTVLVYGVVAVLVAGCYLFARERMLDQSPVIMSGVSAVTLNFLLFIGAAGWVFDRMLKRTKLGVSAQWAVWFALMILLFFLFRLAGMTTRFG